MKRIGIFFFYDASGIVDEYVSYYLINLKQFVTTLVCVVNGKLTVDGRKSLESVCDQVLVRENSGYDSAAYRYAIESIGYDELKRSDELILCNFTCFGPIFPFDEMFQKMDNIIADFWGIQKYPRNEIVIDPIQKTPYVPEHVMSYFMVIRNRMLSSPDFKTYWDTLEIAKTYAEAVCVNELRFTPYFHNRGFKSAVYMPEETFDYISENSATFSSLHLLKHRCPLLKRRVFSCDYGLLMAIGDSAEPKKVLSFVRDHTDYDTNLILNNLIRTTPGSLLKRSLHLNYFLPSDRSVSSGNPQLKVAIILYCYYEDRLEYALSYLKNVPQWIDIYIYVTSEKVKNLCEQTFKLLKNNIKITIKENRGQLASTVLVSAKNDILKYDLVCITQTKKTSQLKDKYTSDQFSNHVWNGVLFSKHYIENVVDCFKMDPYLGYACAIPPHWKEFESLISNELTINKEGVVSLLHRLGIEKCYFDDEPITSYGEGFWVRPKAIMPLLDYHWTMQDFPLPNEMKPDGTILHAIERIYPMVVRSTGYYSGWVMPVELVSVYFDNIYYFYRSLKIKYGMRPVNISDNAELPFIRRAYRFVYRNSPRRVKTILLKLKQIYLICFS